MNNGKEYELSNRKMTVWVKVDEDGIIRDSASVVWKFRGQPLENLKRWMRKQGKVEVLRLDKEGP